MKLMVRNEKTKIMIFFRKSRGTFLPGSITGWLLFRDTGKESEFPPGALTQQLQRITITSGMFQGNAVI
jgi:hypothetical protein